MRRYHRDLGFPRGLKKPTGIHPLSYTHHAQEAAVTDRYGPAEHLPEVLNCNQTRLVEVTIDGQGRVIYALYRAGYDKRFDLCLAVDVRNWSVRTLWLNERIDAHTTLNISRYAAAY